MWKGKSYVEPDSEDGPYIFVSYARKDEEAVQSLLRWLKEYSYRFWYDRGIPAGDKWAKTLVRKIMNCEQFLIVLSPNAAKSEYVLRELRVAVSYRKTLIAVYLSETKLPEEMFFYLSGIQSIKDARSTEELFLALAKTTLKPRAEEPPAFRQSAEGVSNQFLAFSQTLHRMGYQGASFFLRYKILEKIGEGGISEVYTAEDVKTGNIVIVKKTKKRGTYYRNAFSSERDTLLILTRRKCPFAPALLDWYEFEDELLLVESLIPGQSLNEIESFSEEKIKQIAIAILQVLRYLHTLSILHLDIKPSNIFLDMRPPYDVICLIDFNLSKIADEKGVSHAGGYTRYYAPPEQLQRQSDLHKESQRDGLYYSGTSAPVSFSSDLYALGITLKVLLLKGYANVRAIREYQCPVRYFRKDISPELEQVIRKMTRDNPDERYHTAKEALDALENYGSLSPEEKSAAYSQSVQELTRFQEQIDAIRKSSREFLSSYSANPNTSFGQTFFSPPTYLSEVVLNTELNEELDEDVDCSISLFSEFGDEATHPMD